MVACASEEVKAMLESESKPEESSGATPSTSEEASTLALNDTEKRRRV